MVDETRETVGKVGCLFCVVLGGARELNGD